MISISRRIGARFQEDVEKSCEEQSILFHNIKDVFLPPDVRKRVALPKNKYDALMFTKGFLFPMELKSTKGKSLSFNAPKEHQIDYLLEDTQTYEGVIGGLLINFREPDNRVFFVPIKEYVKYQELAPQIHAKEIDNPYNNKVNRASIPMSICEEIGLEVKSQLKRTRYRYYIDEMTDRLIEIASRREGTESSPSKTAKINGKPIDKLSDK